MTDLTRDPGADPIARSRWLLVAAAVAVVATVAAVLTVGLARPPELAAVDDATTPVRSLALLGWGASEGQCLLVVSPAGEVRTVRCGLTEHGQLLGWDDEGIVLVRYASVGEQREVLDPITGETRSRTALGTARVDLPGLRLPATTERREGVLTVRDADGRVRWEVASPDSYDVRGSAFDPADGTLALLDSAGRLLVLAPGATAPRIWVADLELGWAELVWEGTPALRD